ncbi:DUF4240 domain-containing protein [Nonomuraea sp. SBT364]|uniref:DUF4240 domain-containing protein n=1 Tax=Nonomuraea sp. SBT364 TaxID=1580530 RepID=UPI00066AEF59|nr:DUF4240 domain-containing protein [Nonomuraea sp. SBT364]
MDIDGFWDLVERSARETGNREERVDWLENHLSALTAEEIVDYRAWFTICANRACTWDMYAVCWTITGYGSSNGFEYFVHWLISLGRESFERVTGCPDLVLELPEVQRLFELSRNFIHERSSLSADGALRLRRVTQVRFQRWPDDDYPSFELFSYVTYDPYRRVTGDESAHPGEAVRARGIDSKFPFLTYVAEPDGEEWDFDDEAEFARRLPRLARRYGPDGDRDGRAGRRTPWRPRSLTRGDERNRTWTFRRRGADRIALRELRCPMGIQLGCTAPDGDDFCFCAL